MTDYFAMFGQICKPHLLDSEVARIKAKHPDIFSPPSALPTTKDQEDRSAAALPFVSQSTGD